MARVEAVSCDSVHEAAWLERNMLEGRRPPWNRALGGNEVPVAIRVDGEKVHVGSARVTKADIHASNGVVHAGGSFLLPGCIGIAVQRRIGVSGHMPHMGDARRTGPTLGG